MGKCRAWLLLLIPVAALAHAGGTKPDLPIRAAHWLAPEFRERALTEQPPECAEPPSAPDERMAFEIGRAAFRAPLLLGGQAARAGLRCESCHANGRRNPGFDFPGLSGVPGTADVTSSMMSSHRGNDVFDPRPIPDLAAPGKVSRDPANRALETFIHGLIVEEFDGAEPPPRVLGGLATYVRAIGAGKCMPDAPVAITLHDQMADARRALAAATWAWDRGDAPTVRLMLGAARSMLGQVDERFVHVASARTALRGLDLKLLETIEALDRSSADVGNRISACRDQLAEVETRVQRSERQSLFNPKRLHAALNANAGARRAE